MPLRFSGQKDGLTQWGIPVLAVCGYSGSGKTTLLESAIRQLVQRGLKVAVVKHDAHGFTVDRPGKDSDRFFQAGASVALRGEEEEFYRRGKHARLSLDRVIKDFSLDHDLILVEGHKSTPLPKVWMATADEPVSPESVTDVVACLPWDSDRLSSFLDLADKWLYEIWVGRPIYVGIELRTKADPKTAVEWMEEARTSSIFPVYLLGGDDTPRRVSHIPIPPDLCGPLAGILTANRWAPYAAWIIVSEPEWVSPDFLQRIISRRKPGTWAVLPSSRKSEDRSRWALYEPQALAFMQQMAQLVSGEEIASRALESHLKIEYL